MLAKMHNDDYWISETRPDVLHAHYDDLLSSSGFHIMSEASAMFSPCGYTCVWVLSESHLAIHTFPERGRTYVQLTSCVRVPFEKFVNGETYERVNHD